MFLLIFLCAISYVIYNIFVKPVVYWQNKGVFHVKPWSGFAKVFLSSQSFFESVIDAYKAYPDRRYYGSYQFLKPSMFVRDLDLAKKITVKDFENFPDHESLISNTSDSLINLNLFSLKSDKWRDMRSTLSPAFTSSKMRSMYTLIQETAENFTGHFLEKKDEVIELEMKDIFSRYTIDVIANCAFGIKCDSLKDETNEFFSMGTTLAEVLSSPRGLYLVRALLAGYFPDLFKYFGINAFPPYIEDFFRTIVKDSISLREKGNIIRPDMIHLLMEARKGRLTHETEKSGEQDIGFATVNESWIGKSASKMEITDDLIAAQAISFFFAGFDTTSTMLSFLFYELALNPDVQTKLQNEIDEVLRQSNGKVSYEEILKMKYLDQVISETLRRYPAGYVLTRVCAKNYRMEARRNNEVDFVLDKGAVVVIPVAGIHWDPKYFPEPEKFDPERFSEENKGKIVAGSYIPFGSGPRNCIGSRFALMDGKAVVVSLLSKFEVVPTKRTGIPIKLAKTLNISAKGGFWLGLKKRISQI